MAHEFLILIVLPTYNGSRNLREAIQSCLDQCCGNSERALVLMEAAWWARCRGDRKLAWVCLRRSLQIHPLTPPVSKPKLFVALLLPDRLIRRRTRRSGSEAPADPGSRV